MTKSRGLLLLALVTLLAVSACASSDRRCELGSVGGIRRPYGGYGGYPAPGVSVGMYGHP